MWLEVVVGTISEYKSQEKKEHGTPPERSVLSELQKTTALAPTELSAHQTDAQQAGSQQHEGQWLR